MSVFFFAILLAVGLFSWFFYRESMKHKQQLAEMGREQKERDKARCAAIEEGLMEWLETLKLPQFEEGTNRRESARRLCIVLVEQLLHGPKVH